MPHKDIIIRNKYMREYILKRYHERMRIARERLGGACHRCGSENKLHFDHIDASTKTLSVAKMWSVSFKRFEEEVEKCQLLCEDCHKLKSRESGDYGRKDYKARNSL